MEKFIRTKTSVNFRKDPVVANNVIKTLPAGTELQVLSNVEGKTFYYAKLMDGTVGYITSLSQYVEEFIPEWLEKAKLVIAKIEFYMNRRDADGNIINTPYVYGSSRTNDNDFDCSDLMQWCFDKAIGIQLPWDSRRQAVYGQVVELDELRTGDLLFFDTNGDGVINHVGMYIDKDIMLHTNNPTAKINYITFASGSYWRNKFVNARRVIQ